MSSTKQVFTIILRTPCTFNSKAVLNFTADTATVDTGTPDNIFRLFQVFLSRLA